MTDSAAGAGFAALTEFEEMDYLTTTESLIELNKALHLLLDSPEHADFEIVCNEKVIKVHSLLLWSRSKFFAAACHGGFKEGESKRMELPDEDPFMITRMIQHCYCHNYAPAKFHAEKSYISPLMTDVKMYALGEKYAIQSLKDIAAKNFSYCLKTDTISLLYPNVENDIGLIIAEVYNGTPAFDRGLRDPLIDFAAKKWLSLSSSPGFRSAIAKIPDFAISTMDKIVKERNLCKRCDKMKK